MNFGNVYLLLLHIQVLNEGLELSKIQSTTDDTSCLPTLQVTDIPKSHKQIPTGQTILKGFNSSGHVESSVDVQTCIQPTNGVIYLRLVSDVSNLPSTLRPYLPLFCQIVTRMGAGDLDYRQQSEKVDLKTGGLEANNLLFNHPSDIGKYQNSVCFSSYCLERNLTDMLDLWSDIFLSLSLTDNHRFFTLLSGFAAESASSLTSSGHRFAMTRSASTMSPFFALKEEYEGVTQLNVIKNLVNFVSSTPQADSDLPFDPEKVSQLLDKMKVIASHVLVANTTCIRASLNASSSAMDHALHQLSNFHKEIKDFTNFELGTRPISSSNINYISEGDYNPVFAKSHLEFPFQVNYIGKAFPTVPFTNPEHASLHILSNILKSKYLHREIREKGGAYGGGSEASSNAFYFYSYRDPNFSNTLKSFSDSVSWACDGKFTDQDISEAKLSVFSQVDQPISPGNQGMRLFLRGLKEEQFAEYRQQLLSVSRGDVIGVATKYLTDNSRGSIAIIGPKNDVSSASPEWSVLSDN